MASWSGWSHRFDPRISDLHPHVSRPAPDSRQWSVRGRSSSRPLAARHRQDHGPHLPLRDTEYDQKGRRASGPRWLYRQGWVDESRIPQRMTISCQGPEPTYTLHVQSALISATGIGSEKAGQVVWQDFSSPSCELPLCERVALQASNGQYVVAEGGGGGVVNANRDAVGHWETFRMHQLGGGSVALQADNACTWSRQAGAVGRCTPPVVLWGLGRRSRSSPSVRP